MKQEVKIDQADYTVIILVRDTSGNAKTGLAFGDIDLAYARVETDNDVTTTDVAPADLVTPLLTDPHLDWGFLEISAGDNPGLYRLDLADAVFATGAWSAVVTLTGAGLEPSHLEFMMVPEEPYAANGSSLTEAGGDGDHLTESGGIGDQFTAINLPNQTMDITGTITGNLVGDVTGNVDGTVAGKTPAETGDAMNLAADAIKAVSYDESTAFPLKADDAGATQIARVGADGDTLETLSDQIDLQATLAICTEARLAVLDAANLPTDIADIPTVAEFEARTIVSADYVVVGDTIAGVTNAGTVTGNVNGLVSGTVAGKTPSEAGDLMGLANDAITSAKYDESTAFPVKSDDTGATQIARVGADGDTLETLSDQIDGTSTTTELNKVPKSDGSATWNATAKASINAEVADVMKTDNISEMAQGIPPTTPTFEEAIMYLYMALTKSIDIDASLKEFYNNAGTVIWKKSLSDDGTNYVEAKGASGP